MTLIIRHMVPGDWQQVATIYKEGIATGIATFESKVPSYDQWDAAHIKSCRLIAELDNTIVGWASLSPVSSRCVYGGVAEVSVYVGKKAWGNGVGKTLMHQLIRESEKNGYWTLQSGIFPENKASIQLHEKVGFRFLGKREKVGKTVTGIWKDNLLFERRSQVIGVE